MAQTIQSIRGHFREMAGLVENSDAGWDADLSRSDVQLVRDIAALVIHALDPDILGMYVFEDTGQGVRVAKAIGHKHECGQRLTGPAVTVESA